MKKYLSCIICIAVIICFMFSSCMGVPQVTEPIADPSDQKFNTWDQYLPITLKTESGNESRVAVKLVLETDNAEENKVRERLASDERLSAKMILDDSPGWNMDMMRLVKIRLLIMPWENSNFTEDKVLFTVYTGMYLNGNALGGACFGPIESEQVRTSSTFSTDLEDGNHVELQQLKEKVYLNRLYMFILLWF